MVTGPDLELKMIWHGNKLAEQLRTYLVYQYIYIKSCYVLISFILTWSCTLPDHWSIISCISNQPDSHSPVINLGWSFLRQLCWNSSLNRNITRIIKIQIQKNLEIFWNGFTFHEFCTVSTFELNKLLDTTSLQF